MPLQGRLDDFMVVESSKAMDGMTLIIKHHPIHRGVDDLFVDCEGAACCCAREYYPESGSGFDPREDFSPDCYDDFGAADGPYPIRWPFGSVAGDCHRLYASTLYVTFYYYV